VAVHPIVALALVALVANDHLLKARWPGAATGLASGVAGLVVLPAILAIAGSAARRRDLAPRTVDLVALVVALGYASVELLPLADRAYEAGLGLVGWPVRALTGSGRVLAVEATADPWDLLALPAAIVVPLLWRRAAVTVPTTAPHRVARPASARRLGPAVLVVIALPALLATSPEREPDTIVPAARNDVELTPDSPVAAFAVAIDVTAMDDAAAVELLIGVPHDPGEPEVRWYVEPALDDGPAAIGHAVASSRSQGRAEDARHPIELLGFGECERACRVEARVVLELADRTTGSWSHPLSVAARFPSARAKATISLVPDPPPPPWAERVLATRVLGLDAAGDDAVVLRPTRPSTEPGTDLLSIAGDPGATRPAAVGPTGPLGRWDPVLDLELPRCADLADCSSAVALLPVIQRPQSEYDQPPDPRGVERLTALRRSATDVGVELVPATRTSTVLSPRSSTERIAQRVRIAPGSTLYATVVPENEGGLAVLEATRSTGDEVASGAQPALVQVEACDRAAQAPCIAIVRVGSSGVGSVTLHTFEVRD
jgi:hypothetical protein